MERAVVLLSGGLDSTTCLGLAVEQGFEPIAVSFRYGQRHERELSAAREVAAHYGVRKHYLFEIGMFCQIGRSALTDRIDVPKSARVEDIGTGIPVTYVPARNTVFLAHALGVVEVERAWDVFIGVNALDDGGYPDCRRAYIESFECTANRALAAATDGGQRIRLHAPLIDMNKTDIVRTALRIGAPLRLTHSCYDPTPAGLACGHCDSCLLRLRGFAEAGAPDPAPYAPSAA